MERGCACHLLHWRGIQGAMKACMRFGLGVNVGNGTGEKFRETVLNLAFLEFGVACLAGFER